jgi:hypothetical protein
VTLPAFHHPSSVRGPLLASLAVVLALATIGSFGVGFGVLTDCTTTYRCTVTACSPCAPTSSWLTAGWIGQGVLLLVGGVLAVLAARRVALPVVRVAALALGPLSVALIVVTTVLAVFRY